jgi:hypothetical protein
MGEGLSSLEPLCLSIDVFLLLFDNRLAGDGDYSLYIF